MTRGHARLRAELHEVLAVRVVGKRVAATGQQSRNGMRGRSADIGLERDRNVAVAAQPVHGVDPRDDARDQREHDDGLVLLLLLVQLLQDEIVRLIPADLLPPRVDADALLRVRALHGLRDAVLVVELHDARRALAAQMAPAGRTAVVALDLHELSVHHMAQDAASVEAHVALRGQPHALVLGRRRGVRRLAVPLRGAPDERAGRAYSGCRRTPLDEAAAGDAARCSDIGAVLHWFPPPRTMTMQNVQPDRRAPPPRVLPGTDRPRQPWFGR